MVLIGVILVLRWTKRFGPTTPFVTRLIEKARAIGVDTSSAEKDGLIGLIFDVARTWPPLFVRLPSVVASLRGRERPQAKTPDGQRRRALKPILILLVGVVLAAGSGGGAPVAFGVLFFGVWLAVVVGLFTGGLGVLVGVHHAVRDSLKKRRVRPEQKAPSPQVDAEMPITQESPTDSALPGPRADSDDELDIDLILGLPNGLDMILRGSNIWSPFDQIGWAIWNHAAASPYWDKFDENTYAVFILAQVRSPELHYERLMRESLKRRTQTQSELEDLAARMDTQFQEVAQVWNSTATKEVHGHFDGEGNFQIRVRGRP